LRLKCSNLLFHLWGMRTHCLHCFKSPKNQYGFKSYIFRIKIRMPFFR
jgi:hypothetical protein